MRTTIRTKRFTLGQLKAAAVVLGIAGSLVSSVTISVAARGDVSIEEPALVQTNTTACEVNGRFYLTPAEGLRRVGSWTDSASASDDCPSHAAFHLTPHEGLRRIGAWTQP